MVKGRSEVGRCVPWRNLLIAVCAAVTTMWTSTANATITQGGFSVFGFFESREEGRWGEGGSKAGTSRPATYTTGKDPVFGIGTGAIQTSPGRAAGRSGGSFDFNHWDLDEARQLADIHSSRLPHRQELQAARAYRYPDSKGRGFLRALSSVVRRGWFYQAHRRGRTKSRLAKLFATTVTRRIFPR